MKINYKKTFFLSVCLVFLTILSGCSGKVQTNPLPQEKSYVLPNIPMQLRSKVPEKDVLDFDSYARDFFMKKNEGEYQKNIWQIGLEREHYKELGDYDKKYKK